MPIDDIEGLARSARVVDDAGEQVGAVLHMGERQPRPRTDGQVRAADRLTEAREVRPLAPPDEAWPEDHKLPAVALGQAPGDALLPDLGDCVAVALVKLGCRHHGGTLVELGSDLAPVVHRKAAR